MFIPTASSLQTIDFAELGVFHYLVICTRDEELFVTLTQNSRLHSTNHDVVAEFVQFLELNCLFNVFKVVE